MSVVSEFIDSLSPRGQAKACGFLAALVGEKAPEDLQRRGYGVPSDPFADDEDLLQAYTDGYDLGLAVDARLA